MSRVALKYKSIKRAEEIRSFLYVFSLTKKAKRGIISIMRNFVKNKK